MTEADSKIDITALCATYEYKIETLQQKLKTLALAYQLQSETVKFYGEASSWVFERMRRNESAIKKEDISLPNKYKSSGRGGKSARAYQSSETNITAEKIVSEVLR